MERSSRLVERDIRTSSGLRSLLALIPLAIALIVFTLLVGPMLIRHEPLGTWLFAGFLVAHGLIHGMFIPRPERATVTAQTENPFSLERSWMVPRLRVPPTIIRPVGLALTSVTIAGYVLAGLCTVGLAVPGSLWTPLIVISSFSSLLVLVIAFAPGLVLGVGIDLLLVWLAITSAWQPGSAP
jgi:hypothetical protein